MDFPGFLRLVLPTFFLLYAFAGRAFHPELRHRQIFGNRDFFLELWFDASPSLPRQTMIPYLRFKGELISGSGARPVTGFLARRLGKTTYHLKLDDGLWEGVLRGVPSGCDGFLEIRDLRTGRSISSPSRLKAGFCVQS